MGGFSHVSNAGSVYVSDEHFTYTYDIAVCIGIQYIRCHLSAYVL